jgi:hypothetical protein
VAQPVVSDGCVVADVRYSCFSLMRKAGIGAVHGDKRCHNQRLSLKDVVLLS